MLVYIDDLIIAGNDSCEIRPTKHLIVVMLVYSSLNINILLICFFQYGIKDTKPLKLLIEYHLKLHLHVGDPPPNPVYYQQLVGKLMYLIITRPDIAFTVHILSQFMHKPTSVHMQVARRVFWYLSGSPSQGIFLALDSKVHLTAFCDSDWGGCPYTRRSTIGYCILLG